MKTVCLINRGGKRWIMPIVRWEAETLRDAGYRVSMSTIAPKQGEGERIPGINLKMLWLMTRRLPGHPLFHLFRYVEFVLRSFAFGLKNRSNFYVSHDVETVALGYVLSRLTGAKLVYYSLDLYGERSDIPCRRLGRWAEKWALKHADATIACEPNRARFMVEEYGAPELPVVVRNAPPYSTPRKSTKLKDMLRAKGIEARKIALYQGTISEFRCAREFIRAGKFLDDGVVLVMIGGGGREPIEHWYSMIEREGSTGKVIVLPPMLPEELEEITPSADVGLQLLHNLGINDYYCAPIKLYQYLMAGLPVVGCDFPGAKEVIEGENVGLCVSPTDVKALAAAINRLCSDEDLNARMRENALRVAKEKYNYNIESRKILELFEKLSPARTAGAS